MTQHAHAERVDGCYRCDLSADELPPRQSPEPDASRWGGQITATSTPKAQVDLAAFLEARYWDDYLDERGDADEDTAKEWAARMRRNIRLAGIDNFATVSGGREGHKLSEARRYSTHPDFDPDWLNG